MTIKHDQTTVAVVGAGLIGCSFALALKRANVAKRIIAIDRDADALNQAEHSGAVDATSKDISSAKEADFIFVAVPVLAFPDVAEALKDNLKPDAVVFDASSVKGTIIEAAREQLGKSFARFVPCHPIAGKEFSGASAADAELFKGRSVITCADTADTDAEEAVNGLWAAVGARVVKMDVDEHDKVFAVVSHLPHALAYALVGLVDADPNGEQLLEHAASGFRDFTRIASSHPEMWRDILLANRGNILEAISRYRDVLGEMETEIRDGDADSLRVRLDRARKLRNDWLSVIEQ